MRRRKIGGKDHWSVGKGDLPSARAQRIEPPLRGAEDNPVFRILLWRRKARRNPFEGRGALPAKRLIEDLWGSGVTPGVVACGVWADAARSAPRARDFRHAAALIGIALALALSTPLLEDDGAAVGLLRALIMLTVMVGAPVFAVVFGITAASMLFDPYSRLRQARRNLGALHRRIEKPNPFAQLMATLFLGPIMMAVALAILSAATWVVAALARLAPAQSWNFLVTWGASSSMAEICAGLHLAGIVGGFAAMAPLHAIAKLGRRRRFLDLTRDATKIYRLWRDLNDLTRPPN